MDTQNNNKKQFRFRYFIDKPFQTKFILNTIYVILFGMAITFGVLWYYSQTKYEGGIYFRHKIENVETNGHIEARIVGTETANRLQLFWEPIVEVSMLYIVLLIIYGLFYSHRMAGPLYRIEQDLRRYINGEKVDPIRLRKKDHFKQLVELLNKAIFNKKE